MQQPADFLTLTENYANFATSFIETSAGIRERTNTACHNDNIRISNYYFLYTASGSPFFLYLAFQHTHHPQFAGKQFTNTTIRGMFGDAITEMDSAVGQVVQALKSSKVDTNTFLFFTADNG
jgi:arylsulfatase A